jgi:hypothetical protein
MYPCVYIYTHSYIHTYVPVSISEAACDATTLCGGPSDLCGVRARARMYPSMIGVPWRFASKGEATCMDSPDVVRCGVDGKGRRLAGSLELHGVGNNSAGVGALWKLVASPCALSKGVCM